VFAILQDRADDKEVQEGSDDSNSHVPGSHSQMRYDGEEAREHKCHSQRRHQKSGIPNTHFEAEDEPQGADEVNDVDQNNKDCPEEFAEKQRPPRERL
jgi:hypothetical protein